MRTLGLSPKVFADFLVSVVAFLVAAGVVHLDPVAAAALAKVLGSAAAIAASPGHVVRRDRAPSRNA